MAASAHAQRGDRKDKNQPDPPAWLEIPSAPVLTPEEALGSFKLVDGFKVEIVAAEPLIHDPVALRIDEDGRLWVVEMQSFMPDVDGTGEDAPISRIVILEDGDGDGRMDCSKTFLDGLVLPRALQFVEGGVLYADQQQLYFVPVGVDDKPGEPVVVDSRYSGGGNVEHKANGLLRGLDNWIYNAKSSSRYRQVDGGWLIEKTEARGQWGISQDDYGRLFYNGNSSNVYGDWVPASAMMRNTNINKKKWEGTRKSIVGDNRVFPLRVTAGVNRGYQRGMLDGEFKLKGLTAACGPQIYRGTDFPEEFYGNAFTPAPCCNLIKRNLITEEGARLGGTQAYAGHEFLASSDERFRPVALENAPDGSLYVVDFYRGIIQHKTYVTSYLRRQIESRGLDRPTGLGRIYRIVSTGTKPPPPPRPKMSSESPAEWVAHLRSPDAWWRETAQRLLVDRGGLEVVDDLVKLCGDDDCPLAQIHALWTLEGLGALTPTAIAAAADTENSKVLAAAIRVAELCGGEAFPTVAAIAAKSQQADVDLQLALSLGRFDDPRALKLLAAVLDRHAGDQLFSDAALSGLRDREAEMLTLLQETSSAKRHQALIGSLGDAVAPAIVETEDGPLELSQADLKRHATGKELYGQFCFACHGESGEGLIPLAPPLVDSEWVSGSPMRLAAIILNGVEGSITVAGEQYDSPEIQPMMPGLKDNPDYDDEQLAAILTYIRNAFGHRSPAVPASTIGEARKRFADRDLFTEGELREIE
jgi:mono/diheme cytochrome c family protein/glucose/arabinose dehydrogenase